MSKFACISSTQARTIPFHSDISKSNSVVPYIFMTWPFGKCIGFGSSTNPWILNRARLAYDRETKLRAAPSSSNAMPNEPPSIEHASPVGYSRLVHKDKQYRLYWLNWPLSWDLANWIELHSIPPSVPMISMDNPSHNAPSLHNYDKHSFPWPRQTIHCCHELPYQQAHRCFFVSTLLCFAFAPP